MHTGHTGSVSAVCALELDGRPVIASASDDGTVRVWTNAFPEWEPIAVHALVLALAPSAGRLIVGLDVGVAY